ncbi:MAG: hypothetical protein K2X77_21675 [Candidatus Obscuribacterales bacterium]|nr:hypothetical protein [Candidatus Obscuribacterales bacterium]
MSYDLSLIPRPGNEFSRSDFLEFFESRPNYVVQEDNATYMNDATGIYFTFDFTDGETEDLEAPEHLTGPHLAFNLNYYRPHIFGLEAAIELSACIEHFNFTIDDPQNEGMGVGEFSEEGFLRGWNSGNFFAIKAIQNNAEYNAPPLKTIPDADLEKYWRWSYEREEMYDDIGIDVFVPRIFYFLLEGQLRTATVWTDAIPVALPRTELVVFYREQLQKKILGFGKSNSISFVKFGQLEPFLKPYPLENRILDFHLLYYEEPPKDLADFFRDQPETLPNIYKALQTDEVFGREMVAKALRS